MLTSLYPLRNIARTVPLNGVQNAVLDVRLNADSLEAVTPRVARRDILVGYHGADEFADPILDPPARDRQRRRLKMAR
jgi:hypothetical protein